VVLVACTTVSFACGWLLLEAARYWSIRDENVKGLRQGWELGDGMHAPHSICYFIGIQNAFTSFLILFEALGL
jgi:hypothetical protein